MPTRQDWFDKFCVNKETEKIKEHGDIAMYVSKDIPDGEFVRAPIYHVWSGNYLIYWGLNIQRAEYRYGKLLKGLKDVEKV